MKYGKIVEILDDTEIIEESREIFDTEDTQEGKFLTVLEKVAEEDECIEEEFTADYFNPYSQQSLFRFIRSSRVLSPEEEKMLAKRIAEARKKDKILYHRLIQELVVCNLKLVAQIAFKYASPEIPLSLQELIDEGVVGCIKAAKKFDPERGTKFSTYGTWWIRQSITRAIMEKSRTIRIPIHALTFLRKIIKTEKDLFQELGRNPNPGEIAEKMDCSRKKIERTIINCRKTVSLEDKVSPYNDDLVLGELIKDENSPDPIRYVLGLKLKEELGKVLATLKPMEEKVIRLRFGIGEKKNYTLKEIGRLMNGLSRERIRQIEANTLKKLKNPKRKRKLKPYMDET